MAISRIATPSTSRRPRSRPGVARGDQHRERQQRRGRRLGQGDEQHVARVVACPSRRGTWRSGDPRGHGRRRAWRCSCPAAAPRAPPAPPPATGAAAAWRPAPSGNRAATASVTPRAEGPEDVGPAAVLARRPKAQALTMTTVIAASTARLKIQIMLGPTSHLSLYAVIPWPGCIRWGKPPVAQRGRAARSATRRCLAKRLRVFDSDERRLRVAVVGGGIAGLSAAWLLSQPPRGGAVRGRRAAGRPRQHRRGAAAGRAARPRSTPASSSTTSRTIRISPPCWTTWAWPRSRPTCR